MTTSKLQLSHSAIGKYETCPRLYDLHYNKKIRTVKQSSNFLFGSAMDAALNELLKTKLVGNTDPLKDPQGVFLDQWSRANINGVSTYLPHCLDIEYSKADLDTDLLTSEGWDVNSINLEDPSELNTFSWQSLAIKAHYMLKAYRDEVLPQINKVLAIQKNIELENDNGDIILGVIDFIAEFNDGHTYICDNKTTSSFGWFGPDSIRTSDQLTLYGFSEGITKAAYIPILKKVSRDKRKKNSTITAKIRIIKDDLDLNHQQQVLKKYDIINAKIKNNEYPMNTESCLCVFNRVCPYFDFCHKNGDMSGLIQKEIKNK